jgi:hypothetical protein
VPSDELKTQINLNLYKSAGLSDICRSINSSGARIVMKSPTVGFWIKTMSGFYAASFACGFLIGLRFRVPMLLFASFAVAFLSLTLTLQQCVGLLELMLSLALSVSLLQLGYLAAACAPLSCWGRH